VTQPLIDPLADSTPIDFMLAPLSSQETLMTTSITDDQIRKLSDDAAEHGDRDMVAICWVALYGTPNELDLEDEVELAKYVGLSKEDARAQCRAIIDHARTQE
jgi:hypothetical protein